MKWVFQVLSLAVSLYAAPGVLPECSEIHSRKDCQITVDGHSKQRPAAITVRSRTNVVIHVIHKSPLESVKLSIERAAVEPTPSPVKVLLDVFAGSVLGGITNYTVFSQQLNMLGSKVHSPSLAPYSGTDPVLIRIEVVRRHLTERAGEIQAVAADYKKIGEAVEKTLSNVSRACGSADVPPTKLNIGPGADEENKKALAATAEKCTERVRNAIGSVPNDISVQIRKGLPVVDGDQVLLAGIDKAIKDFTLRAPDATLVQYAVARNAVGASLESQMFALEQIKRSRDDLASARELLSDLSSNSTNEVVLSLPSDRNTELSAKLVFKADGKDRDPSIPITVRYKDVTWATPSLGVAFTTFQRQDYAVAAELASGSTESSILSTATNRIKRNTTTGQVIPISFINFRIPGFEWRYKGHDIGVDASLGAGVNVGNQEAEFAFGPGVHFGRVQLSLAGDDRTLEGRNG